MIIKVDKADKQKVKAYCTLCGIKFDNLSLKRWLAMGNICRRCSGLADRNKKNLVKEYERRD
jgi:hypothetical protein